MQNKVNDTKTSAILELGNNFLHGDQLIGDVPISSMIQMPTEPLPTYPGMRKGLLWVQLPNTDEEHEAKEVKVWIALKNHEGAWEWCAISGSGGSVEGNVAYLDKENNFTKLGQSIDGHAIASVKYSSTEPKDDINGYHVPKRLGSLYVMIPGAESVDKRVRIWSSWQPHLGVFEWAEVTESPFNAKTNIENTFTQAQKYSSTRVADTGKKAYLASVISNGVNKTPVDYGKNPDHNGQMLLSWREHTPEGGGVPVASELSLHLGINNTWLPLQEEPIDETTLAKTDVINQFTEVTQYIGATGQKRQINTCRVKFDNISPALDTTWPAYKNGEETVWINADLGEVSAWKAIATSEDFTPTHNVWKMIWSSKDTTVRTSQENTFTELQYLDLRSDGGEKRPFIVASRGSSVPHAQIYAQVVGQVYIEEYSGTGTGAGKQFRVHVAREVGTVAWECIHDSMFETDIANDLASINTELDNVAASAGQNASDITTALAELETLKTEVDGFDGRITTAEDMVAAATADVVELTERTADLESWKVVTVDSAIEVLSTDVNDATVRLQNHEGRIVALEAKDTQHTESITDAHTHAQGAHDAIALHEERLSALEDAPDYSLPATVAHTNVANIFTQRLTVDGQPIVVKDTNYPRFELWMGAEDADTNVRFGSVQVSDGVFSFIGKNSGYLVQTAVKVPAIGSDALPANLISDQCTKFTDLESKSLTLANDTTGHTGELFEHQKELVYPEKIKHKYKETPDSTSFKVGEIDLSKLNSKLAGTLNSSTISGSVYLFPPSGRELLLSDSVHYRVLGDATVHEVSLPAIKTAVDDSAEIKTRLDAVEERLNALTIYSLEF